MPLRRRGGTGDERPGRQRDLPPTTDRRAENSIEGGCSLDWMEFSVKLDVEDVKDCLSGTGPRGWLTLEHGAYGYAVMEVSDQGVQVFSDKRRPEVHVCLKGDTASRMAEETAVALASWVIGNAGHFSRVDLQATVPHEVATVEDFKAACARGEAVKHARKGLAQEPLDFGSGGDGRPPGRFHRLSRGRPDGKGPARTRAVVCGVGRRGAGVAGLRTETGADGR